MPLPNLSFPIFEGLHWAVFLGAGGIWAGYFVERTILKKRLGQVKYSMDFMERHKQDIPIKSEYELFCGTLQFNR